ncbi:MAG TPA: ArsA-related P-loop ATPase [Hyphomicrobiaceae bacterium]|nr:ArsA-related P-loop ATPase [Hyphomicrobiaceae bacterium]
MADLIDELAHVDHGLVMVMGKGGVGKTTVAAAIAVALAKRGLPIHLTTTDPAQHIREMLASELPGHVLLLLDTAGRYHRELTQKAGPDTRIHTPSCFCRTRI